MASRFYVIMGGTGHIGYALTLDLLKRGHKIKAVGRESRKLNELKTQGAEIVSLEDFTQEIALTEAFKGADAIFSFIPPGYNTGDYSVYEDQVGEAIKTAIQQNDIHYVLNLSSIGAELPQGGPISGLYRHEQRLNSLADVNVLHLRPSTFMENLLWSIHFIKHTGFLGLPIRDNLPVAMIATKDIGMKAAELLDSLDFKGHTQFDLVGPRDLTMKEVTKVLGNAINKPDLKYAQIPYVDAEKGLIASGLGTNSAKSMIELYRAINEELIKPTQDMTSEHRGKTTIEEFAKTFAQAFAAK